MCEKHYTGTVKKEERNSLKKQMGGHGDNNIKQQNRQKNARQGEKEGKIPYTWREEQVHMKIFENKMRIHGFSYDMCMQRCIAKIASVVIIAILNLSGSQSG